jgi:hypothetical protein
VDHYIGICKNLKTQIGEKGNLFDNALRRKNDFGGKPKRDCREKRQTLLRFSPVRVSGSGRILTVQQEKNLVKFYGFFQL